MKIPAINIFGNYNIGCPATSKGGKNNYADNQQKRQSVSFGVNYTKSDLIYRSSILYHKANIIKTTPSKVEEYFRQQGIPAFFQEGSDFARKMVAYCCYHTSEIFSQLHYIKPKQIGIADFRRLNSDATGLCFYGPSMYSRTETYPARAVLFNTFAGDKKSNVEGKNIVLDWENFFDISMENKKNNFLSSGHFLSPFIHEFAHSLHYHKIFSKFGVPFNDPAYIYNPNSQIILDKLNMKLDNTNPYVSSSIVKNITQNISQYGAILLPETFAEAFTKAVLEHIDVFSLRLIENPFPMKNNGNNILNQVLYETFEGLVGDGAGLI